MNAGNQPDPQQPADADAFIDPVFERRVQEIKNSCFQKIHEGATPEAALMECRQQIAEACDARVAWLRCEAAAIDAELERLGPERYRPAGMNRWSDKTVKRRNQMR